MRVLAIAVVMALALGFTVKDMATGSAESPSEAISSRAEGFDESMRVSETGTEMRQWIFETLGESDPMTK